MTRLLIIATGTLAVVYVALGLISPDAQFLFGGAVFLFGVGGLAVLLLAGLLSDGPKARR